MSMEMVLFLEIIFLFGVTLLLLHKFSNWHKNGAIFIIIVVALSWYFSFLTVVILPMDISTTLYRQCLTTESSYKVTRKFNETMEEYDAHIANASRTICKEPFTYIPDTVLQRFWRIVYWTCFILTWFVLPIMQSYVRAGDFTFFEKVKAALKDNISYYGTYFALCCLCLFYIVLYTDIPLDGMRLRAVASSASNTWSLFLLVILLGFALVDIPRKMWMDSDVPQRLKRSYFEIAKLNTDYYDAEMELRSLVQKVYELDSRMNETDPLKVLVQQVVQKIPVAFQKGTLNISYRNDANASQPPTKQVVVYYHKKLKSAIHVYSRASIQRERLYNKIFSLQKDVSNSKDTYENYKEYLLQNPFKWPDKWKAFFKNYLWRKNLKPFLSRGCALGAAFCSLVVLWSEFTFFIKDPVLSIFAIFVKKAAAQHLYLRIENMCLVVLLYISYCAYSTVLKIRVFNYYNIVTDHQTDEHSLIFSGVLLSRLTPALCLNFLGLLHMDSHVIKMYILETQYTQVMGHMDVISIISDGFNVYFPMMMLVVAFATYFDFGSHILTAMGFPQYLANDEITDDTVTEGQRLVIAERERRYRRGLLSVNEIPDAVLDRPRRDERFTRPSRRQQLESQSTIPSRNLFDDV